jgi:hypothetical protein
MYEWTGDGLEWRDPDGADLHLEVSVRDRGDGRFVPAVGVTAILIAPDGTEVGRSSCRCSAIPCSTTTAAT